MVLQEFYQNKHVLITGATGFLGNQQQKNKNEKL